MSYYFRRSRKIRGKVNFAENRVIELKGLLWPTGDPDYCGAVGDLCASSDGSIANDFQNSQKLRNFTSNCKTPKRLNYTRVCI